MSMRPVHRAPAIGRRDIAPSSTTDGTAEVSADLITSGNEHGAVQPNSGRLQ